MAEVQAQVAELLLNPQTAGHVEAQVVELLWGTPGTVPTQEAASHGQVLEILAAPNTIGQVEAQVAEILWLDLTFEMQVEAQTVELLWGTPGAPRTQDAASYGSVAELLVEPDTRGHLLANVSELMVEFGNAVAIVDDIKGSPGNPATFDGTTSTGLIYAYRWNWVTVPLGSTLGNVAYPYPDFGGTVPIDMTSNVLLYHAEETVGSTGADTSGSGNTANLTAVTVGAAGQVGDYSWNYTGSTSKAVPTVPTALPSSGWTIAFWFYNLAPTTAWRTGVRGSADHQIVVELSGDRLGVYMGGGFHPTDTEYTLTVGGGAGWHHLAAVGTATGNTRFYVDGLFVGAVAGWRSTDTVACIGNFQGDGQRFAERLDEIAVWHRALSDTEISNIYVLQEGSYTAVGPTFTFVPDLVGTYEVNLTVVDGVDLSLSTDTALADIRVPSGLFPLQGDKIRYWSAVQGVWLVNPRGGNKT